jgi:hypothetical protein
VSLLLIPNPQVITALPSAVITRPDLTAPMLPTIWAEKRCRDGNSWPRAHGTSAICTRKCSSIQRLPSDLNTRPRADDAGSQRCYCASRVSVCEPTECGPAPTGRWWRTRQALAGKPHAPREAASVHPAAGGAADARALVARATVPARRPRSGCSHESLAADRCARGHGPVRQFAGVGSRGPHPSMLVGVSGPDVHDRQVRQAHPTTAVGRQRLSQSAAPMPAGILGRLWRVPLLGFPREATMSAIGIRAGRAPRPASAAEKRPTSRVAGIHAPSALRDAPRPGASRDRCGRHR